MYSDFPIDFPLNILCPSVFTPGFCNEVCYDELGCFDTTLTCHRDFFPPLPPEKINTYYVIYTRERKGNPLTVTRGNVTRESVVSVVGKRRVTFIIHGWGEGIWKEWVNTLRDALLEQVSGSQWFPPPPPPPPPSPQILDVRSG